MLLVIVFEGECFFVGVVIHFEGDKEVIESISKQLIEISTCKHNVSLIPFMTCSVCENFELGTHNIQ